MAHNNMAVAMFLALGILVVAMMALPSTAKLEQDHVPRGERPGFHLPEVKALEDGESLKRQNMFNAIVDYEKQRATRQVPVDKDVQTNFKFTNADGNKIDAKFTESTQFQGATVIYDNQSMKVFHDHKRLPQEFSRKTFDKLKILQTPAERMPGALRKLKKEDLDSIARRYEEEKTQKREQIKMRISKDKARGVRIDDIWYNIKTDGELYRSKVSKAAEKKARQMSFYKDKDDLKTWVQRLKATTSVPLAGKPQTLYDDVLREAEKEFVKELMEDGAVDNKAMGGYRFRDWDLSVLTPGDMFSLGGKDDSKYSENQEQLMCQCEFTERATNEKQNNCTIDRFGSQTTRWLDHVATATKGINDRYKEASTGLGDSALAALERSLNEACDLKTTKLVRQHDPSLVPFGGATSDYHKAKLQAYQKYIPECSGEYMSTKMDERKELLKSGLNKPPGVQLGVGMFYNVVKLFGPAQINPIVKALKLAIPLAAKSFESKHSTMFSLHGPFRGGFGSGTSSTAFQYIGDDNLLKEVPSVLPKTQQRLLVRGLNLVTSLPEGLRGSGFDSSIANVAKILKNAVIQIVQAFDITIPKVKKLKDGPIPQRDIDDIVRESQPFVDYYPGFYDGFYLFPNVPKYTEHYISHRWRWFSAFSQLYAFPEIFQFNFDRLQVINVACTRSEYYAVDPESGLPKINPDYNKKTDGGEVLKVNLSPWVLLSPLIDSPFMRKDVGKVKKVAKGEDPYKGQDPYVGGDPYEGTDWDSEDKLPEQEYDKVREFDNAIVVFEKGFEYSLNHEHVLKRFKVIVNDRGQLADDARTWEKHQNEIEREAKKVKTKKKEAADQVLKDQGRERDIEDVVEEPQSKGDLILLAIETFFKDSGIFTFWDDGNAWELGETIVCPEKDGESPVESSRVFKPPVVTEGSANLIKINGLATVAVE